MATSLNRSDLLNYTLKQVYNFFPDSKNYNKKDIISSFNTTMERIEYCFSKIRNKYFFQNNDVLFNHLHGDQYSMFLYILSNTLYKNNYDLTLCEKLFLLNKSLFSLDAFYEIELPEIFLFVHPLGTVLGRAKYSNYLIVYQRCNIGSNHDIYPELGEHLTLHPRASILGKCHIGRNVKIATDGLVIDKNIENDIVYIGNPKNYIKKSLTDIDSIWLI